MTTTNLPLLTLVTVTKNCVDTIDATLTSVAAVKQAGVEYVVIDGVSTDGTLEKLQAAGGLIDILISEPDSGIYNAMNKATVHGTGTYIGFINGDDELIADGFPTVLKALARKQSRIISATTLVGSSQSPDEKLVCEPWKLYFHNSVPHPSTFVARDLMSRWPFKESLKIAGDYDFFLRCYLEGERFQRIDVPVALHHRGGASANTAQSELEVERIRADELGWRMFIADSVRSTYRAFKRRK